MPVFNGEALIRQAIDSAIQQTYKTWELIVVDDGSTDRTAEVVKQYTDSRIRYIYQTNHGQAAALNRGLELVAGEYVTTLDADDFYTPESLECRVRFLEQHPGAGVAYGDGVYCDENGKASERFTELMPVAGVAGDVFDDLIVSPFYGTGAAVLVRQSVLRQHSIRYDDIKWCQDWDIYIRLASVTEFAFVNAVVINYRVHAAGMTMTMPSKERRDASIKLREKVVAMPRFARTAPPKRAAFYYDYLTRDLDGEVDRQRRALDAPAFQLLSKPEQARLVRLMANQYLSRSEHSGVVRSFLRRALRISPSDLKTAVVFLLASISPSLARTLVAKWQSMHQQGGGESPFERAALKH
jgi:glycosyltransferase involved in cell wall biosynthesis